MDTAVEAAKSDVAELPEVIGHWNYRVMRHKGDIKPDEFWYAIHEVHYASADDSKPIRWSDEPTDVLSETTDGLRWILERMELARSKPILDYDDHAKVVPDA